MHKHGANTEQRTSHCHHTRPGKLRKGKVLCLKIQMILEGEPGIGRGQGRAPWDGPGPAPTPPRDPRGPVSPGAELPIALRPLGPCRRLWPSAWDRDLPVRSSTPFPVTAACVCAEKLELWKLDPLSSRPRVTCTSQRWPLRAGPASSDPCRRQSPVFARPV